MDNDNIFLIGLGIVVILFFTILFGLTGAKLILGISILLFLPIYLILNNFDLKPEEKIIFSIFLGLGIYSSFVYILGLLFNSIGIAVIVTFILLLIVAFLVRKFRRQLFSGNKKPDSQT